MSRDFEYIRETFKLAQKAEGCTSPNPLVGALIVKDNKIVSKGYHKRSGSFHAEIEAINKAKIDLTDSTLYVNLEPCCHFGKTFPCVDKIIERKIKKVVISTIDPNPRVNGKSIRKLKKAGVKVKLGVLAEEAKKLNEVFFKNMQLNRPFVAAKVAQSLDGKIATVKGQSKWVTNVESRRYSRSLRDRYDCVLIGGNTFKLDNPSLNGIKKIPYKVVVSTELKIPSDSWILRKTPEKLIIFTSCKNKKILSKISCRSRVFFLKEKKGQLSLKQILKILYKIGVCSVFIEGGANIFGNFFSEKLIDKIYFFIAPKIIGGNRALSSVGGNGFSYLNLCPDIRKLEITNIKEDIFITGYPSYPSR